MKNQKLLTVAALAGLTLGGLSFTAASAQDYGDDSSASAGTDATGIVLVQDEVEPDSTDDGTDGATDGESDGERDGRDRHRGGCHLEEAAAAIGIDEATLEAALDEGQSIAEVAEANGVDVDEVIDAMVAADAERIEEKVAEGRLTEDEAAEKLAELEAKTTERVTGSEDSVDA